MTKVPAHLGGHMFVTHIDRGALRHLKQTLGVKTMLDIGCGPAGMQKIARELGIGWTGVDGDPSVAATGVITHDFATGPCLGLESSYDLGWCVEVVEHVDERFLPNVMSAIRRCKAVVLTYAPPGWPGHHHVNCQPERYWIEQMSTNGFQYDEPLTGVVRSSSEMVKSFMRDRGLVFRRKN